MDRQRSGDVEREGGSTHPAFTANVSISIVSAEDVVEDIDSLLLFGTVTMASEVNGYLRMGLNVSS